jgi:predicted CxxxxCH...CXXCH cytochrome family protein
MNDTSKIVIFLFATLFLFGCSSANEKAANIDSTTGKHPSGWAASGTGGQHPSKFFAGPSACYECHGKNLDGGISGVSCFTASRSGINCHPDGPMSGHPVGWSAPGVHGASAKAPAVGRDGMAQCTPCHGSDFAGGGVNRSCLNTAGCHGASVKAPHSPKPWLSKIGGRTHTNTDASNAAACAQCHSGGGNSSRKPSVAPSAGSAPGCFNNTLCHGVEGHVSGWNAPSAHGAVAKAVSGGERGFNSCVQCHGVKFDGGSAEQTCLNTAGCHGASVAAPHPAKPWRSTAGGLTHVSTDTSNAGQCVLCHTGGANSTRAPRLGDRIGLTGCFNNTLCHGASGHPDGWKAPGQHGVEAKKTPTPSTGFSSCQTCHGAGFINGAAVTCFNNAPCHGSGVNAPHARKPWFSRGGGLTHTNTDTANVGTCAICHTAGTNSTVKPPAPATMTLAGCFNNTLCHFHQIPYAPSATIPASLHGGEAKKDLAVCQACHGTVGTPAFDGLALAGGNKTIACSSCHIYAKAHSTDWQGSGIYSHRSAGNRADACMICHDVTQGRTAPLPNSPSCFSSTFTNGQAQTRNCHPGGPGSLPHGVPYNNHNATARGNFTFCLSCHQIAVNAGKPPGCQNCHLLNPVANPNNCISCHSMPPNGTTYPNIASSHASHATMNVSNTCAECHSGLGLGTVDHLNRARVRAAAVQPNPVVFGTLATTGGLPPGYNSGTGVCSNTYCHGASLVGGSNKSPQWGQTGYLQGCGTCHGFPPANGSHTGFTSATPCAGCHKHVNANNTGFTDPTKHINGLIDVQSGGIPNHPGATPVTNRVYPGALHMSVGNGYAASCGGCHDYTNAGVYPAAGSSPPNCKACHTLGLGTGCSDCHGDAATGRPNVNSALLTSFPTRRGQHLIGNHVNRACTVCHPFTTGNVSHGWSNRQRSSAAQVGGSSTSINSWNPAGNSGRGSCLPACHGSEAWY